MKSSRWEHTFLLNAFIYASSSSNQTSNMEHHAIPATVPDTSSEESESNRSNNSTRRRRGTINRSFVSARSVLLQERESVLSPGFRSAAAMAGWDDESLLLASFDEDQNSTNAIVVVDDSPVRHSANNRNHRKREERTPALAKTPVSACRRTRRARRHTVNPDELPRVGALSLDDDPPTETTAVQNSNEPALATRGEADSRTRIDDKQNDSPQEVQTTVLGEVSNVEKNKEKVSKRSDITEKSNKEKSEHSDPQEKCKKEESKHLNIQEKSKKGASEHCYNTPVGKGTPVGKDNFNSKPACLDMDKLREELSCAICLDVCFEPASTACGHSFCKSCLQDSIQKCGPRCPKCRQKFRGEFSTSQTNTILWNTIQLLFPKEISARMKAKKESEEKAKTNANSNSAQLNRITTAQPNRLSRSNSSYYRNDNSVRVVGLSRPGSSRNFRSALRAPSSFPQRSTVQDLTDDEPEQANSAEQRRNRLLARVAGARGRETSRQGHGISREEQERMDAEYAARLQEEELRGNTRERRRHQTQADCGERASSSLFSASASLRAMAARTRVRNQQQ